LMVDRQELKVKILLSFAVNYEVPGKW